MIRLVVGLLVSCLLGAACLASNRIPIQEIDTDNLNTQEVTSLSVLSGYANPDADAFAESQGITLGEAQQRLEFQQTIGDIQPLLQADMPDTFAGLWIEHQPEYRIVIALTEGDESTIRPYVAGKPWSDFVEFQSARYSLAELLIAQRIASQTANDMRIGMSSTVDVINNRVELYVGNPELFSADLQKSGIKLPEAIEILSANSERTLPDTNLGRLDVYTAANGRSIYLPKQPPTAAHMAALIEGTLIEKVGCLRVISEGYDEGFFILWPYDTDIRIVGKSIDLLNGDMESIARVGEPLRMGGGAMESELRITHYDELIPGLPIDDCPGPYWISSELETLVEQAVPDIYVNPYTSGGRLLAIFISQSRPAYGQDVASGELTVDEQGCMRVGDHVMFWPPGIYLREKPLRLVDSNETKVAEVGDYIHVMGSEKGPGDYRYFDNKIRCSSPYWGASTEISISTLSPGSFPAELTPTQSQLSPIPSAECIGDETADIVWPNLTEVLPRQITPASEIKISGSGGYVRCGDAYIESSRSFPLKLDEKTVSSISCYANHCEGVLTVPVDAHSGLHTLSVAGGSSISFEVISH